MNGLPILAAIYRITLCNRKPIFEYPRKRLPYAGLTYHMDPTELRTLRLLEEIDKQNSPSQRDLSHKLNISLGLVNSFVKRLAQKGYCKVTTIPKNRVRYLLTPKGAAEKTRLTYEYIQSSISFYHKALHKVKELFIELSINGVRKIVFCGVSDLAEISYYLMQETSIQLTGIVDNSQSGKLFRKTKIVSVDQLATLSFDMVLITDVIAPLKACEEIRAQGIDKDRIAMI